MNPNERAAVIREERKRIQRALPLAAGLSTSAEYRRGWWDALNLCLDAIDPERQRGILASFPKEPA